MKAKEIIEGDFEISKFMGYTYPSISNRVFRISYEHLHCYHKDWRLLMPVVEKFNSICQERGRELSGHIRDQEHLGNKLDNPLHWKSWSYHYVRLTTSIDNVWQSLVQSIKWYNTNTQNQN